MSEINNESTNKYNKHNKNIKKKKKLFYINNGWELLFWAYFIIVDINKEGGDTRLRGWGRGGEGERKINEVSGCCSDAESKWDQRGVAPNPRREIYPRDSRSEWKCSPCAAARSLPRLLPRGRSGDRITGASELFGFAGRWRGASGATLVLQVHKEDSFESRLSRALFSAGSRFSASQRQRAWPRSNFRFLVSGLAKLAVRVLNRSVATYNKPCADHSCFFRDVT